MQGCPDLGPDARPIAYKNQLINVGSCGTSEINYLFDRCPGYYLRRPALYHGRSVSLDGITTPFDLAWQYHFSYKSGHSIGNPPPPKLLQSIYLFESQLRAREVLNARRRKEENDKRALHAKHPNARIVAKGR